MSRSALLSARSILPLLSLALMALQAGGCHPTEPPETRKEPAPVVEETVLPKQVCTMSLHILMARLVDASGRPVEGATVVVSDPEGRTRTVEQYSPPMPGLHTVFMDGTLPLSREGTPITARFSKDGKHHSETYLLATDGCHFHTLSAPDTVRTLW